MWATYTYGAGASQANVLSDLIAILTGTTDKTTLSAACMQANTSIGTAYSVAGWSLYDASAGTNEQCLRALNQDGSTYKYYNLITASATVLTGKCSESWNSGTHAGTNSNSGSGVWASAGGGTIQVYASVKNIVLAPFSAGVYQGAAGMYCMELSRDTIPSGYPCAYMSNTASPTYAAGTATGILPRVKAPAASGDYTATNNVCALGPLMMPGVTTTNGGILKDAGTYRDAAENVKVPFYKMGVSGTTTTGGAHHWGTVYDLYMSGSFASAQDEISYNGVTYIHVKPANSFGFWVPKG